MCGICGVWQYSSREPVNRDWLQRMTNTMVHRGPDDSGSYFDDAAGIGFGFRRLSIIDLSPAGHQPMSNEDGSVWGMCNGEIYNFIEIRSGLEAKGHLFRSRGDTEVIVHDYEERGEECVTDLDGMFAAAIWDARRRRLVLARDRLGKKPLYYYDDGRRLLFASELKALVADASVPRTLDWRAVGEFLALGNVAGSRCIFSGIRKLPPGHWLLCEGGKVVLRAYWDWLPALRRVNDARSEADWVAEIRATLRHAVRSRMISDVPLGAFLSGGVDSSAVVATMSSISPQGVKTFSAGFAESRYNELDYARAVARHFGTEHHELIVEPEAVQEVLPRLIRQYDEPFADASALPTYYLAKMAREHVTVALSGDGGDEACAGYDRYAQALREQAVDAIPLRLRRLLLSPVDWLPIGVPGRRLGRRLMLDATQRYVSAMRYMPGEQVAALLTPEAARHIAGGGAAPVLEALQRAEDLDPLSRMQYADATVYLPDDVLVKIDRASMLNSLEVRCPFLDHHFLELMASVPARLRLVRGQGKYLLKRALRGVVPEHVLHRPKMGFGVPLQAWFRGDLAAFVREIAMDPHTTRRGIFAAQAVEKLVRAQASLTQLAPHLWAVVVFELWCRAYLDEQ
jgi:asparagine synthase (glutamine-hydrolysing)